MVSLRPLRGRLRPLPGRLRQRWDGVSIFACLVLVFGAANLAYGLGLAGQQHPPLPRPEATAATAMHAAADTPGKAAGRGQPAKPAPASLPAATPTAIRIPDIQVVSPLIITGLHSDGTPAVPAGADVDKAAWLRSSVSPGQSGTSVIIGHVDTLASGPSVFYNLGKLLPGQKIYVSRDDGKTAVFSVDSVQLYDKSRFPSQTVYGTAGYPALRLITCGGDWDGHDYTDNTVVFASLVDAE